MTLRVCQHWTNTQSHLRLPMAAHTHVRSANWLPEISRYDDLVIFFFTCHDVIQSVTAGLRKKGKPLLVKIVKFLPERTWWSVCYDCYDALFFTIIFTKWRFTRESAHISEFDGGRTTTSTHDKAEMLNDAVVIFRVVVVFALAFSCKSADEATGNGDRPVLWPMLTKLPHYQIGGDRGKNQFILNK